MLWRPVARAAGPPIQISPAKPKQGDTLVVTANLPDATIATLRFRDREFPMFNVNGKLRCLLGTSPDTKPGSYELVIKAHNADAQQSLQVARGVFSIQRLKIPESRNKLRKDPRIPDDKHAIYEAFARQTEEQMWHGAFAWPVKDSIRTQYGLKRIVNGDANYGWHKGYDIRGKPGAPVKAAADGLVSLMRECVLEGNTIVIDHGQGVSTIHMHLSKFEVQEGQRVKKGEVIGRVGSTGISSGPHLHWGVYVNGVAVSPKTWLTKPPQ